MVLENDGRKINIPLKLIVFYTEKSGMTGTIKRDTTTVNEDTYRDYPDQYFSLFSAFPIKKGESYYRNNLIFDNIFAFGIHKNFSLTTNLNLAPIFIPERNTSFPYVSLSPKFNPHYVLELRNEG